MISKALHRFWTMLAHYHGQTWNASELGRSMGLSDKTVRSYLDILTGTFMIRQLQPWHENIGKRQVKSPKVYFRNSGMLHSLLNLSDFHALTGSPRVGASPGDGINALRPRGIAKRSRPRRSRSLSGCMRRRCRRV
ncbi:DUF4143 domain-containing protein [Candidatus Methylomirabilis limnetica]|uniref:DUF4143 domain-containing protein n=1 Tax=Candidatus Methylomirabilis limnetica TaxID=2033718 RepID=UPI003D77944F